MKTLHSQADKIDQLKAYEPLFAKLQEDSDASRVQERYNETLKRYELLLINCGTRSRQLEDARKLQLFLRECNVGAYLIRKTTKIDAFFYRNCLYG